MKKILFFLLTFVLMTTGAWADITFVNGGFESGDLSGWNVSAWNPGSVSYPAAGNAGVTSYTNSNYYGTQTIAQVNSPGTDSRVPIPKTYNGSYAGQVGDQNFWGGYAYQYNQISQTATVTGATPGTLYFAWAAVLEQSYHGGADTPYFSVQVIDDTTGSTIYDVQHYEGDGGAWIDTGSWFYSVGNTAGWPGWTVNELDLAALGVSVGDSITLKAIARDCNPTGHAMYVYLDGFGGTPPPPPSVPEPTTMLLLGLGLVGLAGFRKRS